MQTVSTPTRAWMKLNRKKNKIRCLKALMVSKTSRKLVRLLGRDRNHPKIKIQRRKNLETRRPTRALVLQVMVPQRNLKVNQKHSRLKRAHFQIIKA